MLCGGTSKDILLQALFLLNESHTCKSDPFVLAGELKMCLLLFLYYDISFETLKHLKLLMTFMWNPMHGPRVLEAEPGAVIFVVWFLLQEPLNLLYSGFTWKSQVSWETYPEFHFIMVWESCESCECRFLSEFRSVNKISIGKSWGPPRTARAATPALWGEAVGPGPVQPGEERAARKPNSSSSPWLSLNITNVSVLNELDSWNYRPSWQTFPIGK